MFSLHAKFEFRLLVLLGLGLLAGGLGAETFPEVEAPSGLVRAATIVSLEDPADRGLNAIRAQSDGWTEHPAGVPAFSYTDSPVWLRFALENPADAPRRAVLLLDTEYINEIDLYGFAEDRRIFARKSGRMLPFDRREFPTPKFAFSLEIPTGRTEIYLRVRSHSALNVPIFIMSPGGYDDRRQRETIFLGMAAGLFLLLVGLNLVFYYLIRDRNILAYLTYLISGGIFIAQFSGYFFKLLWPDWPIWNGIANSILYSITQIAGLVFMQSFLRTRLHLPGYHRLQQVSIGLAALPIVLVFISMQISESFVAGIVLPICMVAIVWPSVIMIYRGASFARIYLLAWLFLSAFMLIYVLQIFGFLPTRLLGFDQMQYPVLGIMIEMTCFPFALGDRLVTILRETRAYGESQSFVAEKDLGAKAIQAPAQDRLSRLTNLDLQVVDRKLQEAMETRHLYREELSLAGLAEVIGINAKDLSEYLNKHRRSNFYNFLNGYRIGEARRLLIEHPRMKIIEISQLVGFNSLSAFNSAFSRDVGMSPRKYRTQSAATGADS